MQHQSNLMKFKSAYCYFILSTLFVTSVVFSCSSNAVENIIDLHPPSEPADQHHFRNAFEINRILGKGINLGNALEAPNEGEWGMVIEEEFIQLIKDAGFESVRIPIRWNAHALTNSPYTIDQAFFDRVDEVAGWSLDRGLAVMINIHHYNELMQQPQPHRQRFLSLWDQIAEHYKHYPEELVFEVLNEPHDNLTPDLWNTFFAEALDVIRKTNPKRVVVAGTANWGGFEQIRYLRLPEDDRQLIVSVHSYEPFHFTHQGADWVGQDARGWIGTTWDGTDAEKAAVDQIFGVVEGWAETYNRPIHVGEFGVFYPADDNSRERWTSYIRESSEIRNYSWAYWEFGAGFGVYDRDNSEWRDYLLRALIPDSPLL